MLVTINPSYKGVYGHYVAELGTVVQKRAGCEPFDVDPAIAKRHISNGVMVAAAGNAVTGTPEPEPVEVKKSPGEMTYPELKAAAKERGISVRGLKKEAIAELIAEYDAKSAPSFEAEAPV
ncbi:MAG: hypothetical protein IJT16_11515 [Lachnospiraceae bacterium]|nr:hypothetical protein [Lachnospiraceae bacterium]